VPGRANERWLRLGTWIAIALAVVGWTILVAVPTLVAGYLWGYTQCPNVGPGIYWGTPESSCASGYYQRAGRIGFSVWILPLVAGLAASWLLSRRNRTRFANDHQPT